MAIIAMLADSMSEENVAIVVAELIDAKFSSSPTTSPQHNRFGRPQLQRRLVFNRRWNQWAGIWTRSYPTACCAGARVGAVSSSGKGVRRFLTTDFRPDDFAYKRLGMDQHDC